ncbi:uncharacterized protein RCC_11461 [Ramularia collo-cygni]|uniref:Uncharacterized protein n=1 Tax=Ramularia collo-cygni TaxID=112498 RepID=A0A2D3V660_9PEZI|nr:uncharacterized protein RCC_11461 [Ramularia collo-cygni]CZT25792.1 uncharacterized protein RCC_11461 [Ramularia collo-cygni]
MATPSEPLLAFNIWSTYHEANIDQERPVKRLKISSGVSAIDTALDGGFDVGSVTCITSEPDHGANDLVHGILVAHLLNTPNASATVIDSSHSLDLRRLYKAIEASTKNREAAIQVLDRLKIMKVFDYVGLTEAMFELRESLEERAQSPAARAPKATIPDSQDDDEEVLDNPPPVEELPQEDDVEAPNLLIIDSISHVIAPLIKNNYTQGQALLSSLMRSLGHLTRTQNLCTVVLSTALTNKPSPGEETLSLFRSCTVRPLLGPGFGYLLDVHMYLHRLPRRSAETHGRDSAPHGRSSADMVNVLEVVQDKFAGRFGRWAPFVCGENGRLENMP